MHSLPYPENEDYRTLGEERTISRDRNITRQCFELQTYDDDTHEPPEKLGMIGDPVSHLIEFVPDETTIWIIDDDSE